MRRWSVFAVLSVAWVSSGPGGAEAAEGEAWPFQGRVDLSGGVVTGSVDSGPPRVASPTLSVAWAFQPLRDDGTRPLGLLEFLQHPDTLGLSATALSHANGTLSGTFHPWRETGVTATLGMGAFDTRSLGASFSVGGFHYLSPSVRFDLRYGGGRSQSGGLRDFGIDATGATHNSGRVGTTLLLGDTLLLSVGGGLGGGRLTTSRLEVSSGSTTLSSTHADSVFYEAGAAATRFFGRRWSASLEAGVSGGRSESYQGTLALPVQTHFDVRGAVGGQYFPWDNAAVRLEYGLSYGRSVSSNIAFVSFAHRLSLSLLLRL